MVSLPSRLCRVSEYGVTWDEKGGLVPLCQGLSLRNISPTAGILDFGLVMLVDMSCQVPPALRRRPAEKRALTAAVVNRCTLDPGSRKGCDGNGWDGMATRTGRFNESLPSRRLLPCSTDLTVWSPVPSGSYS